MLKKVLHPSFQMRTQKPPPVVGSKASFGCGIRGKDSVLREVSSPGKRILYYPLQGLRAVPWCLILNYRDIRDFAFQGYPGVDSQIDLLLWGQTCINRIMRRFQTRGHAKRAVTPRGRNFRLSFRILVWQISLKFLWNIVRIRLNMCPGISLVYWEPLPQGDFLNYPRVTMAHRFNYAFLLCGICGRMSQGLIQWIRRTRRIPTWFFEFTVNLFVFILSGYWNRAIHIGRVCTII